MSTASCTRFVLIRHGAVDNPRKVLYGRLPHFNLSDRGFKEARQAALALGNLELDALYSSPLLRARQTAREIQRVHSSLRLRISSLITEVDTPYEGRSHAEIAKGGIYSDANGAGERPRDIVSRSRRFIDKVRRSQPGGRVAVVTHGDVIFFLMLWARQLPLSAESKRRVEQLPGVSQPVTGSITTLSYVSDDPEEIPRCDYIPPELFQRLGAIFRM